jgi:isopentenyl diphosphate isomerase/L-lactate dehydrogenase-like FMN-dependent dehydrogenase
MATIDDDAPRFLTVDDYEPVARARLPREVFDYFAGGAGDEWTLRENRSAFERWVLRPRVLRTKRERDLSTEILGQRVSFPVLVAPWAYQGMARPDGELATARACGSAGTIMVVSTTTESFLERVAAAGEGPKWWQLYVFSDRGYTAEMLHRVHAAGYAAVMLTVDFPVNGLRHRDSRNGFVMPMGLPSSELEYDPELSWDDLPWVREQAPLPLLVKGILTGEDARIAVDLGADGIVVSNHGGRQLDGVSAAIAVLDEIVEAVGGRVPVIVDGGVRRGTDVLKALALGAAAVMVARPVIWGLAVGGEEGVVDVLEILRREFDNAMALSGCNLVTDVTRGSIGPAV